MPNETKVVLSLLREYGGDIDPFEWQIRELGRGEQSQAFLVSKPSGAEIGNSSARIVVKTFSQSRPQVRQSLNDEFALLSLLNASFAGLCIDGWTVSAPEPYLKSESPPALLMSFVPGQELEHLLEEDKFDFQAVSNLLAQILGKFWAENDRIIGDVNYKNILCELSTKNISIIDPGMPSAEFCCESVSSTYGPASRDLGYLLFGICATNTKIRLLRSKFARHRSRFARQLIVRWAVCHIEEPQFEEFLRELHACAIDHNDRIEISYSFRGIWRRWVRSRARVELQKNVSEIGRNLGLSDFRAEP